MPHENAASILEQIAETNGLTINTGVEALQQLVEKAIADNEAVSWQVLQCIARELEHGRREIDRLVQEAGVSTVTAP
jgi:DNA-binding sugar fermentation-stimulating protein